MTKVIKFEKLISIVMPAYNGEKYIKDSINSVILQSYKNWELIIIDDGSIDETRNIIKTFSMEDDRVKYFKNHQNIGVSETRNKGISLAKGEWIAFLDSDDMWEPFKLEKQIKAIETDDAEFIFTGSSFINEDGLSYKGILDVPQKVNFRELKTHNIISCSSVLIKKKFFSSIKMENDKMHEDYAVWLRILQKDIFAFGINEPLLIYRISTKSKSGNKFKTINMTYKVFRFIGLNRISSSYYMLMHVRNSINKYKKIKFS